MIWLQVCILIEPFGIETIRLVHNAAVARILIEPFGIETTVTQAAHRLVHDFNRTIWN